MIVDDDRAILQCLSKIFQKQGYTVTLAEEGKDAMEKIGRCKYDVALVDLALSDMEGDKLFPLINHVSPRTVKIMLTGKTELKDSIEGADVFVEKPVTPSTLLNIVEGKLKAKAKQKQA